MLVLSRKLNEKIMIGDSIEVSVLELGKDRVKIGITAPKKVSVHRKEVYEMISEQNVIASKVTSEQIDIVDSLFTQKGGM